ncbi:hypothetical protein C1752_05036 [Acaryochloris thomasi RCC1774]|uniref:Divalent heavy-metal cations transporter n=1 Tax=Acaryochloris thomasi RCC1774 TaxID=1764569 RepID=A0A2W1JL68_9CYAN|nr:hypothetical protein [Acaryochloris thomasi]PZD71662.1 hypothetical protein C1752_05036 [Acaryochloris thomasi RCC1774]
MAGPGLYLAAGLALIHAFLSELNICAFIPERKWLSFAGGVSIGYVFLEIFPELSRAQEELEHSAIPLVAYLENHVYIVALFGLLVFYGLDILAINSRRLNRAAEKTDRTSPSIFWLHLIAFAGLNVIFSYLLQDMADHSLLRCILYFIAVALHFFVIDHGFREHHKRPYDRYGRWLLTAAIVVGAIAGQAIHLNEAAIAIVWSFLAGSLILNILTRELPDERESSFGAFVSGIALYTGLLLLI